MFYKINTRFYTQECKVGCFSSFKRLWDNPPVFGISGFSRLVEQGFQEYSLASLNMKKGVASSSRSEYCMQAWAWGFRF